MPLSAPGKTLFFNALFLCLMLLLSPAGNAASPLKPDGVILHCPCCHGSSQKPFPLLAKNHHYAVQMDGKIIPGQREDRVITGACGDFDRRSLSVLVEGRFDDETGISALPPEQEKALKALLFKLMKKHGIPLSQVERHMDRHQQSPCPGGSFPYLGLMRSMSRDLIRDGGRPLLEDICREKGIPIPVPNALMVADKSSRTLRLYSGKVLLKTYRVGLSRRPTGDKREKGDLKTPTGRFYICEKYPMRAWMEFSYPDLPHAGKSLKAKGISRAEYDKIKAAALAGGIPHHGSRMGDDVGIHAAGFAYGKMRADSTAGCVGMEDPEAFELYWAVPLGAALEIRE